MMRGCRKIGECLAYVALASRFGFPKLKVIVIDVAIRNRERNSLTID